MSYHPPSVVNCIFCDVNEGQRPRCNSVVVHSASMSFQPTPLATLWQDKLSRLSDDALDKLPRVDDLGALNFTSVVPKLRSIRKLVEALTQENPDDLPTALVPTVTSQLDQVLAQVDQMASFTVAQADPQTLRQQIEAQVDAGKEYFTSYVRPQLTSGAADVAASLAEVTTAAEATKAAAREAEGILATLRGAAGEVGATEMSAHYDHQATIHRNQSRVFLGLLALAVGGTIFLIYQVLLANQPIVDLNVVQSTQWVEFVRSLVQRVVPLGVATYVVAFLQRNYRINKHLQVVNEFKRNALNTYPMFSKAVESLPARDAITAEVAGAVFVTPDTGFLSGSTDRTIVENGPGLLGLLRPPGT